MPVTGPESNDGAAERPPIEQRGFHVVGIGASAGGLEALEALFGAMPEDSGMAFVVLQHLSPDFESRMVELLGRRTRIPIEQVTDGVAIEPNHIYLIPPRKDMILSGGHLLLTDKDPGRGLTLPIDHFLRSLATDAGQHAVAVILSGTGSDGSRGIKEIHEAGGLVVSQDPRTARFDGMPRSAIDTGVVDLELAPAAIPEVLIRHRSGSLGNPADYPQATDGRDVSTPIGQVLELLRVQYGIDFAHYKQNTVLRRVERRLTMARLGDVESYAVRLAEDRAELNALYFDLLIGVTRFFRDPEAFAYLEAEVIPVIVESNQEIRMWIAGCATGEEVYSFAILLHEAMSARGRRVAKIFATDVHPESLEVASAGLYDGESLRDVSVERRERYFVPVGDRFRVAKDLREMVVFARHNVINDAPFTRLDLVSCRNLLIYLQPPAQKKALSLFHFGLKTSGFLLLGPSETPGELSDEFEPLEGRWKIYRKRRDIRLPNDIRMSSPAPGVGRSGRVGGLSRRPADGLLLSAYDQLMARHVPPAFLVDRQHELLHSFGGAESLLSMQGGRVSTNLLDLVPDGMRAALAGALQQADKQQRPVRYTGIDVTLHGEPARFQVIVEPLPDPRQDTTNFLIELERAADPVPPSIDEVTVEQASRDYVESLEGELNFTRENLQATIEELETSNEELQATNEEMVAANEELQSTNEELHSVNEELHTVNVEHQRKIDQLTEMTEDMDNLLQSTDIGVLFLDQELSVRKFTPRVAALFHLLPQDIGRRFDHFAQTIEYPDLLTDIRRVLLNSVPVEGEVRTAQGELLFVRIMPYRSKSETRGVLLTFVDISSLRRAEAAARRLSAIVRSARDAIVAQDVQGRIVAWNTGALEMYGYAEKEALGLDSRLLIPEDRRQEELELLARLARGEDVGTLETQRLTRDVRRIDVELSACAVFDEFGKLSGMATIARDITARKRAEAQVQLAIAQREQFLALLSHELRNPLMGLSNAVRLLDQPGISDENQGAAREVVRRQVQQMARLLEDLLDSSRMRRDRIELKRHVFDLREAVAGVLDAARPQAEEGGVVLLVDVADEPILVEADLGRLQQLQVNLLNNAINHSRPGAEVRYSLDSKSGHAVISVSDEGDGISPDNLPHIFEPFFQGQRRRGTGMGLGLSLAQAIAQAHSGDIRVFSEGEGQGARFVVQLPLATGQTSELEKERAARASDANHRLVLLVDDDEDSRELLGILLRNAGHEVIHAGTASQGLELLTSRRPRAAIVDLGLPDMSGLEVARRARAELDGVPLKLIALTGFGQQKDREAAADAGFDHHLVKPLDFETIESVLTADD
jgi:two-component system CheB/CheR fusion protein